MRVLTFRLSGLIKAALSLTLVCVIMAVGFFYTESVTQVDTKIKLTPINGVVTDEKNISITFELYRETTELNDLLELLDTYGAKATFFVTGDYAVDNTEDIRSIINHGQEVANLTDEYTAVDDLEVNSVADRISQAEKDINVIVEYEHKYVRFPENLYSNNAIDGATALEHQVIGYYIDINDMYSSDNDEMISSYEAILTGGAIVNFDMRQGNTVLTMATILEQTKLNDYLVVRLDELLFENYHISEGLMLSDDE